MAQELDDIEDLARRFLAVLNARYQAQAEMTEPTVDGEYDAENGPPAETRPADPVNGGSAVLPEAEGRSGRITALERTRPPAFHIDFVRPVPDPRSRRPFHRVAAALGRSRFAVPAPRDASREPDVPSHALTPAPAATRAPPRLFAKLPEPRRIPVILQPRILAPDAGEAPTTIAPSTEQKVLEPLLTEPASEPP
ncbi:MAG TPA: hypothetical protein VLX67_00905, partial [Stellaceae bacterium]|nr:hypothetical protein [Stellaceae bacterium]